MGNSASEVSAAVEVEDPAVRRDLGRASASNSSSRGGASSASYDSARNGPDRAQASASSSSARHRALPEVEDAATSSAVGRNDASQENAQGVKLLNAGQNEEAVRHFKLALASEPHSVQILDNIGLAYAKQQDFNSAYEWYEKAHKQDPRDVETLFSLAWVERKRQRYLHARELFMKVLEIEPEHVKALWLLGDILKTSQDHEGAIRQFERLIRTDPGSVDGHISLAQCLETTKQYPRAAQLYHFVLQQLAPGRMDVQFYLGKVFFLSKQYRQCVSQLDRVPDSDARGFEARTYTAKAYRELEDHDRAIQHAERAAQFRPHPDVLHFLGEEYLRLGDEQKAAHWFRRSLDLEPNHLPSITELGQLMYRQTRWQEAEQHFTRICELDRSDISAVRWLALVKYKLRKDESCKQCCDAVLRSDPLNVDALWLLAELQHQNGPTTDKWFLSLRLPPEVSAADVCQSIAKGYLVRKQLNQASDWLKKVQHYLPSEGRVREAQSLLIREGNSVNPQDVIDLLEQRPGNGSRQHPESYALRGVQQRHRTGEEEGRAQQGGYPEGVTDAQELEKLLLQAERASSRPGGSSVGGSAEQQWKEVLATAKATLRRKPKDAMALRCVARSLLSMAGDASEVKEYARQAMECGDEAAGFTLGFELHSCLGTALERERNYAAAEKHFAAALRAKPGDEAVMLALARTLVGTQRKEKKVQARQLYEQVVASNPGSSEGYIRLAEMSLEADDFSEAYRMAAQAAKLAPSDPTALAILGKASMKTGRTEEGVRVLEQASALQPNTAAADLSALQALAQAHKKAGRDQDAISCFKRVLDARPGDYECNLSLGQLHSARGAAGASQAVHYYRSALQSRPSTREARDIYMQMAGVQCAISAWKDAQQTLEGAVRELPEDAEIWRKLLIVYEEQKDSKGQHQCFRRLGQFGCLQPADKVQCTELLMSEGQFREARDLLDQVLRAEPSNTAALLKVAASWRQDPTAGERALSEAKARYEQVLQLSPSNAEALEGAAYCYRKVNNLEQAITLYQQCLKVKPTAEGPLYYLGDILYKQHRHAECQHYLSRLVETNCTTEYKTGALYILAKSHVSLDEYAEAEAQARTGLAVKPNHPHFLFILALVKNRMADYDSSISTLKKALQHCDAADSAQLVVEIRDWLAQAYERKHEYAAAMAELDRALQQDPSHASSLITQGLVHVHLKQLEQAETSFRRALAVEKNHALALVRLGYCKLLANDYQEATAFFQRALQQRCGTLALPHSVKGAARIYMALSLMSQQDMEGAILQVSEARKSHRNFNAVCTQGKDVIVRGECEGLVAKLRAIPDLDLNLAQAWQLVELMAKDLEIGLKDPAASRGASRAASEAAASPFGAGSPQAFAMSSPVAGGAGQERRQWLSAEIGGSPSAGGSAAPASQERRMWTAQASTPAMSPPAAPERRQWTAPKAPEPPKQEEEAVQMSSTVQMAGGLKLAKHEQIEMDELTQHECLGTGGFGAVYRGYFKNQEVAIKKLFCEDGGNISPLQLDELEKEVAALRSVNHPRLVRFIGACLTPPNLVIVTEFMPGGSLHHLLHKAKTPLTIGQQAKMALQVCEGAAFLHSSKPPVVHRDLKSLNVILDRIYNAKICDFGLTQSMDNTHISLKEGGGGGSPRYMAPECYDCKGKITEKVDVWALGCILVEIFGGPLPYDDCSNIQQIVAKVLIDKEIPYIPNHLPRGVRPVVEDCFNFDPKARTSSQSVYNRMLELNLVTN